jgi:acetyl/propionyl-CoA carboxylase alpha subunit
LDEYAVGGISTTLPFFREVVRDAEFVEGRLDTGFIPRFFARRDRARAGSTAETERETTARDLAVIAAALARDARRQGDGGGGANGAARQSPWKLAGRAAQVRSHNLF